MNIVQVHVRIKYCKLSVHAYGDRLCYFWLCILFWFSKLYSKAKATAANDQLTVTY